MLQMKAALIYPDLRFRVEDVDRPKVGEGEVIVKVKYAGICGTDLQLARGMFSEWVKKPAILGHEFSGTVDEVGDKVSSLNIGDSVVGEPIIPCLKCKACLDGKPNLCYRIKAIGFDLPGAFAEYVKIPSFKVFKIPENVSLLSAALTEPLAVALHAVNRSGLKPGDSVVILGDGTIGLGIAQIVRKVASKVIVVGKHTKRLKVAEEMNVDAALNVLKVNVSEAVKSLLGKEGADIVFEATGNPSILQQAIEISAAAGRIVITGIFSSSSNVYFTPVLFKEAEIVGSSVYVGEFPKVLDMMASGYLKPDLLISAIKPLNEIEDAFRLASERKNEVIKVLLKP
jgi:2-desacetyl-2-hydroxyethyl bacteriochlorophyllide A dehydrogenase